MTWTPSDKPAVTLTDPKLEEMSKNERIKVASQGLFLVSDGKTTHTFADEVEALSRGEAETIGGEEKKLSKLFGIYRQQVRGERGRETGDAWGFLLIWVLLNRMLRIGSCQERSLESQCARAAVPAAIRDRSSARRGG